MSSGPMKPSTFWSRLGRAFVNILRIVLILAVIAGLAAAVYFGTPYLYQKFILPVQTNTSRLSTLEGKQAADMDQVAGQISALQGRLSDLENRQTGNAQAVAELQGQVQAVETQLSANGQAISQLEVMQATVEALSAASAEHEALLVGGDSALAALQLQITQTRAIELLSRARLYLSQSNFGLARQDVQAARDVLAGLQQKMPADQSAAVGAVIARLDLALGNLPDYPVVAVDDVDIAWVLLVSGPANPAAELPAGTPAPPQSTPSSTAEVQGAPTPTP
jgi:hypothetical protein